MKDRSDTQTFKLLAMEFKVFPGAPDAPFGSIAGDITPD